MSQVTDLSKEPDKNARNNSSLWKRKFNDSKLASKFYEKIVDRISKESRQVEIYVISEEQVITSENIVEYWMQIKISITFNYYQELVNIYTNCAMKIINEEYVLLQPLALPSRPANNHEEGVNINTHKPNLIMGRTVSQFIIYSVPVTLVIVMFLFAAIGLQLGLLKPTPSPIPTPTPSPTQTESTSTPAPARRTGNR